jgi:hypothetical protein
LGVHDAVVSRQLVHRGFNSKLLRAYHRNVPISDTTPEARAMQEQILRKMTGEQRLLLAWDLSLFARDLARAGIRDAHPEWTDAQVARELLRLAFLPASLPAELA